MTDERTDFGFKRIECACTACVRNCHFLPGYLIPADFQRIADHMGEADIVRFALENFLASPGATVVAEGECFAIPTIVPARRPDGACRFLKDDRCIIHAVNPFGCAYFSAEQSKEVDAISSRGLKEIVRAWRRGDLYARLWKMLYEAGRIAASPLEARARIRTTLNAVERAGGKPYTSERQ